MRSRVALDSSLPASVPNRTHVRERSNGRLPYPASSSACCAVARASSWTGSMLRSDSGGIPKRRGSKGTRLRKAPHFETDVADTLSS